MPATSGAREIERSRLDAVETRRADRQRTPLERGRVDSGLPVGRQTRREYGAISEHQRAEDRRSRVRQAPAVDDPGERGGKDPDRCNGEEPRRQGTTCRGGRQSCGRRARGRIVKLDPRIADVAQPLLRILAEASQEHAADARRHIGRQHAPVGIARENRGHRVRDGLPGKRERPAEHLVEDAPERPDVGSLVDAPAARGLRAHVRRRSEDHTGHRSERGDGRRHRGIGRRGAAVARRVERLGETEVEDLDHAVGGQLDVRRLQVAVNDPALVRRLERLRDLPREIDRFGEGQPSSLQALGQILAGDQLHREEAMALVLMEAVDRCDVRMVEGGQDLGLPLEASESLGTLGERRREEFQRNLPVELGVSGAPDFAHASRPQGAENLERAEAGGRSEGHFGTDSIPPISPIWRRDRRGPYRRALIR